MATEVHRAQRAPTPTIKTLAEMTGYSIATISKALRESPVVAPATRDLIFKAAREVGYQANARRQDSQGTWGKRLLHERA